MKPSCTTVWCTNPWKVTVQRELRWREVGAIKKKMKKTILPAVYSREGALKGSVKGSLRRSKGKHTQHHSRPQRSCSFWSAPRTKRSAASGDENDSTSDMRQAKRSIFGHIPRAQSNNAFICSAVIWFVTN